MFVTGGDADEWAQSWGCRLQACPEACHLFDERERAALAWAEPVTRVAETGVPDGPYLGAGVVFDERERYADMIRLKQPRRARGYGC